MSHVVDPGPGVKKLDSPDFVSTLFVETNRAARLDPGCLLLRNRIKLVADIVSPQHAARQSFQGAQAKRPTPGPSWNRRARELPHPETHAT